MTTARILRIGGYRDAIRHGRAAWSDGFSTSFHYDVLSGSIRLISYSAWESATDITDSHQDRVPALRDALHSHPQAGAPLMGEGDAQGPT